MTRNAPHNQDARFPADMSKFPHPIIVDMYYGCAALLRWGTPQAIEAIQSSVGSLYYGEELRDSSGEDKNGEEDTLTPTAPDTARSTQARLWAIQHDQPHTGIRTVDEAMDLIMLLWSRSAPAHQEELPAIQKEEDLGRERVNAWRQTQ